MEEVVSSIEKAIGCPKTQRRSNMAIDEKNMALLKKLKALAEQGVGGEKENAQRKLDELMKKYGVDEADLSDDKLEDHDFRYHNKWEKKILRQVIYKVATGRREYRYKYGRGSQTTWGCTCTKAEALQIQIEYEFYVSLWEEELEMFSMAFIQKYQIFDMKPGHKTVEIDADVSRRMNAMMAGMQDRSLNPMLGEGGETYE